MVREERLELSHLTAPEPKSGVSTNSTTPAWSIFSAPLTTYCKWGERRGLNPRPPESQSGALPTELRSPLHHHVSSGTPTRARTWNLRLRRALLYPIELWAHHLTYPLPVANKACWLNRYKRGAYPNLAPCYRQACFYKNHKYFQFKLLTLSYRSLFMQTIM